MDWLTVCAQGVAVTQGSNVTGYYYPFGRILQSTTEAVNQGLVRDTYTWHHLYFRVISNTISVDSTLTSRKNTAAGNQTITIGADATGVFEDTSNTDSLTNGDLICFRLVTGNNATSMTFTIMSTLLTHSSEVSIIGGMGGASLSVSATDFLGPLVGLSQPLNTEAESQVTMRDTTTLSRFWARVEVSSTTNTIIVRLRKNGADGSQTFTLGAATTGTFEDTSNSDSFASGDKLAAYFSTTSPISGNLTFTMIEVESSAGSHPIGWRCSATLFTASGYGPINGGDNVSDSTTTEANTQVKTRAIMNFKYLQAYVSTARTSDSVVSLRQNGANAITLTCAASTTGLFEETSTTCTTDTDDDLNFFVSIVGGTGTLVIRNIMVHQITTVAFDPSTSRIDTYIPDPIIRRVGVVAY